jgi:NAD+-dependent protein deacetylase sirtuin 4
LIALNPRFASRENLDVAPDGDVDLTDDDIAGFQVVPCSCGGALKPRVVYFGENVPADVLADAWRVFDEANALLVAGTSLEVFSGRRFVEEARRRGLPIVIVNDGPTRSDADATVRINGRVGDVLPRIASAL